MNLTKLLGEELDNPQVTFNLVEKDLKEKLEISIKFEESKEDLDPVVKNI